MNKLSLHNTMDINVDCTKVTIIGRSKSLVDVSLEGVNIKELLNAIDTDDILPCLDKERMLTFIGVDKAKDFFELQDIKPFCADCLKSSRKKKNGQAKPQV